MRLGLFAGAAVVALTLSACSSRPDGELDPGQWKHVITVKSMEIPGATAEQQAQIQTMLGKPQTQEDCMDAEKAKMGLKDMATNLQKGAQCKTSDYTAAGGKITGKFDCSIGGGRSMAVAFNGTYDPTHVTLEAKINQAGGEGPGAGGSITVESKSERVGECKAK